MKLIIFEDERFDSLYPLCYIRPVFDLKCGATVLAEKIEHAAGGKASAYFVRDVLRDVYAEKCGKPVNDFAALDGDILLVNGRVLIDGRPDLQALQPGEMFIGKDGTFVAGRFKGSVFTKPKDDSFEESLSELRDKLKPREIDATMIDFPWQLIEHNEKMIEMDFRRAGRHGVNIKLHKLSWIEGEANVYIAPTAKIGPLVSIDATEGPVTIEDGVKILPHTRIDGPTFIGRDTQIVGGKIRHGCSIGEDCRVGGEVEGSIIHGNSNKYHDGFLGHSYICEWVNLGAMTTTSDLKNDYSLVAAMNKGEVRDTGLQFLGSMIGDHTKTSIGTVLNTGSVIGMMSSLISSGHLMPRFVPSFCWLINDKPWAGVGFPRMLETAKRSMARRKKTLTPAEEELFTYLYKVLKPEFEHAPKPKV